MMATPPWNSQRFRFLFADEASLYGVLPTGELMWFPQWDTPAAAPRATAGVQIGVGWTDLRHVFAGGAGVIYAISSNGDLRWYKDLARDGTNGPYATAGWATGSGNVIGRGWDNATRVFSGGGGVIYATVSTSDSLLWFKDDFQNGQNAPDGTTGWATNSGKAIGRGWSGFRHILSGGEGVIYVVDATGDLKWYRDNRVDGSNATDGSTGWAPNSGVVIGTGWAFLSHVFAGRGGQVFACQSLSCYGGHLRQYIDTHRNGTAHWQVIADVWTQWSDAAYSFGWIISAIEGYAWPMSVSPGGTVNFHVSTNSPDACMAEVVRLTGRGPVLGSPMVNPPIANFASSFQRDNGHASDCGWPVSFSFTAPAGGAAWQSGFYAARIRGATGQPYDIPFVVRQAEARGRLAVIVNVNTWNAYNIWGGADNYTATASPIDLTHKRPGHHLLTASQDSINGNGNLRSEVWLVDWLQERYQVDLITDIELHKQPDMSGYKAVLIGSHPEYWTQAMIGAIMAYLNQGGSLLYMGGNGMFRPTYLRSEASGGDIDLMTCEAGQWSSYPLYEGKPLFGAAVQTVINPPSGGVGFTIQADKPFVPSGFQTGLVGTTGWNPPSLNDNVSSSSLVPWGAVGIEIDPWPAPLPAGVEEIGRDASTNAVIATYRTSKGGFVFGAGSITFVGALVVDPILQAIVENALTDAFSR